MGDSHRQTGDDPRAETPHAKPACTGVATEQRTAAEDLLEWAPDAVIVSDREGRIVFANGQAARQFGYARGDLVGAPVELLMPQRFRPDHERHRARYAAQPAARLMGPGVDLVGRRKDGSEFPVEISLSSRYSERGQLITEFIRDVSERRRMEEDLSALVTQLQDAAERSRQAHAEAVMMLAATAEAHDRTTGLHLRNTQTLTEALARQLGYANPAATDLGLAAVLHDIGKIRVAKEILLSPDELSETEWAVVSQHTVWGAEFLVGRPKFELAAIVARYHHERWDGGGYPEGLKGPTIPEEAAIVAVADAFDAMTHDRPYRPAVPLEDAIRRITAASGTQFSPEVARAMLDLHDQGWLEIQREHRMQQAA